MDITNPELDNSMEFDHRGHLNGFIRHAIKAQTLSRESADRLVSLSSEMDNPLLATDVTSAIPLASLRSGPLAQGLRTIDDFHEVNIVHLKFEISAGFHSYQVIDEEHGRLVVMRHYLMRQYVDPDYVGLMSDEEYRYYSGNNDPVGEHGKSNVRAIFVNTELTRLLFKNGIGQSAEDPVYDSVKRTFRSSAHQYKLTELGQRPLPII